MKENQILFPDCLETDDEMISSFKLLFQSQSMSELSKRFTDCLNFIQKNKRYDIDTSLTILFQMLNGVVEWPEENNPYYIIDGTDALFLYLYFSWDFSIEHLSEIERHLREDFVEPQGMRLEKAEIEALLALIDDRFSFSKYVTSDDPLYIILLNESQRKYNSSYYFHKYQNGSICDAVLITSPLANFICSQKYTFLHEIGHVFHCRLTEDPSILPASFEFVQQLMFPKSFDLQPKKLMEVFADCFLVAATYETYLEANSHLNFIQKKDRHTLLVYMQLLIFAYNLNPLGRLYYDELFEVYRKYNKNSEASIQG